MSVIENANVMMTAQHGPPGRVARLASLDTAPEDLSDKLSTELMPQDPDLVKTNKCTVTQLSETNRYKINYSKARLTFVSLAMNN